MDVFEAWFDLGYFLGIADGLLVLFLFFKNIHSLVQWLNIAIIELDCLAKSVFRLL